MISNVHSKWIRLCGVVAVALIIFASVMLPSKWEQLRSGHWAIEHFLAYFATASVIRLGWSRPFLLAGALGGIAAPLLEALQSFEPTHSANFLSVISGAGGAFAAALAISAVDGEGPKDARINTEWIAFVGPHISKHLVQKNHDRLAT